MEGGERRWSMDLYYRGDLITGTLLNWNIWDLLITVTDQCSGIYERRGLGV
jgi:hypothetical protein